MPEVDNQQLVEALLYLHDNSLFQNEDIIMGRDIAFWGVRNELSLLQRQVAGRMIKRYRRLLEKAGFNVSKILKGKRRGKRIITSKRNESSPTRKSIWDF